MPERHGLLLSVGGTGEFGYRVAGRALSADAEIGPLAPFAGGFASATCARSPAAAPLASPAFERPVYRGPAWVGGREAVVSCTSRGDAYVVRVPGVPPLLVDAAGCTVTGGRAPIDLRGLAVEALLGPGVLLALALRGTFALHAAAVALGGRLALLLGASGAGKSTVASAVARSPHGARLADDVVPFEAAPAGLVALPHYPQLKLPPGEQYPAEAPEQVAISAVYSLDGSAPEGGRVATVEPVERRNAIVLLLRHTVASCLFDAPLLARQLEACAAAATAVPVRRLRFVRRLESLPEMLDVLAADLVP